MIRQLFTVYRKMKKYCPRTDPLKLLLIRPLMIFLRFSFSTLVVGYFFYWSENHLISIIYRREIGKKSSGEIFPPGFLTGYVSRPEIGGTDSMEFKRLVTKRFFLFNGPTLASFSFIFVILYNKD